MDNTKIVNQKSTQVFVTGKLLIIKGELSIMIEGFHNFDDDSKAEQKAPANHEGSISFSDLFSTEFMHQYSQFDSIEELLSSGGFVVNSEEDYEAIPDKEIDAHVKKTTKFNSWKEMLLNAVDHFKQPLA